LSRVELIFLFWLAIVCAGGAFLLYVKNFFSKVENAFQQRLASALTFISWFSLLLILLFYWFNLKLHPFSGPFTARIFYAFTILGAYLIVELIYASRSSKIRYLGMFALPVSLGVMFYAWHVYQAPASIPKALQSFWVAIHVTCALIAYGAFTVATILAVVYLLQESQLKRKSLNPIWRKLPSLETADNACYKAISLGEIFTAILILSGMVWAEVVWGKMWQWDPKQNGALAMLIIYGFYIATRSLLGWRGKRASYLAIFGFVIAIFTYFANYLFPTSIHTYGKGF
jgi:cytochrome c-type biogenesis protein CcsB